MKKLLIDKLMQLGYDTELIYSKLNEWNLFENDNNFINKDIPVLLFNKPTLEITKVLLNINERLSEVFLLDGEMDIRNLNIFGNEGLKVANYRLDEELCIIAITKLQELEIIKYVPNEETKIEYTGKSYEDAFASERESLINDYLVAMTSKQRISQEKAKEILNVLALDYIIDEIILENLNPKFKLYDDAEEFANNITSYQYKCINREKSQIEILRFEKVVKRAARDISIGYISNDPYLNLDKVNNVSNFSLYKPSYVWMEKNKNGKEELAIYTATAMYSAKTYKVWWEEKEDYELMQKAEALMHNFSNKLGYTVSNDFIINVLKKLNRELVFVPDEVIKKIDGKPIDLITYNFYILTDPKEFESLLYASLEDYLSGRYRYRSIENIGDYYTLIGENLNYTNNFNTPIKSHNLANFNVKANAAILKKETLLSSENLLILENMMNKKEYDNYESFPLPTLDVIFYFPSKPNNDDEVEFYHQTDFSEYEKKMSKVIVSCITTEGKELRREEFSAWSGKTFTPKVLANIFDEEGLGWECVNEITPSITVREDGENLITLFYDKLKRKVKIKFLDETGNQIKESQEKICQVGTIISYEPELDYVDDFGRHWEGISLDKVNQKVSEKEEKNIVSMLYEKKLTAVTFSFVDESGNKVMEDKSENVQIGSVYKFTAEKEIVDSSGNYWTSIEDDKEFEIKKEEGLRILVHCKPLMTKVWIRYVDENDEELLPSKQEIVQVGATYIPNIMRTWQDDEKKSWIISQNQKREFKIQKAEEYNQILIKYEPVLMNVTILYQDINGKEIRHSDIVQKQLGSEWLPEPKRMIKDEKGNEWQLVEKAYETLKIKENEKENVVIYNYQVSRTNVTIKYIDIDGNILKADEYFPMQVGNAFVPTPEHSILDKENRRWKLFKIQPAMVKVTSKENEVVVTYQPEKAKIIWRFMDMEGNYLKEDEIHTEQIGVKYQPLVEQNSIEINNEKWNLIKIEPYEIVVSEDMENNVVKLIFTR